MLRSKSVHCAFIVLVLMSSGLRLCAANLEFAANGKDGSYTLGTVGLTVLRATAAVKVNGKWLRAADFPNHAVLQEHMGGATEWTVTYDGLAGAPTLLLQFRPSKDDAFGELQLTARNTTPKTIEIQALRLLEARGPIDLGGPETDERVLSDSFSEDRPGMEIHDIIDANKNMHRAVGSQLIFNRKSGKSLFIGALTSDRFLSVLRLCMKNDHSAVASYEVDSTGTTELLEENSLQDSPAQDRVELSLPVEPGATLASERMLIGISHDYHHQLETYGRMIRDLHHARVSAPTPLGWWSWTAYYFGLNEATALTNAEWLGEHLKPLGYRFFHIDEGYQFARGEYATPDATLFPHGMAALERGAIAQGLTPGIWTAPFEVSERSWVYAHHPDWLVHNAKGNPIHLGLVTDGVDHLYALDTTNPGAQEYLRNTYATLVNTWGVRYFKMDFMEDSAVEGYYYKPHTTALEAQRIGIQTIRNAVGDDVLLDKDGCELLNPVGLVDMGRISQDTGHTFSASKDAAPGIAARYYMNRNYFLADPDAFTVSTQTVDDQSWHGGTQPLTLDEAKVSIALAAVSGGLFEIGDDLPTLGESPERLALVENRDLIDMARLGRSSTPIDLMNYSSEDGQPSLFLLRESDRQTILTIFNWTEKDRSHQIALADLGLQTNHPYEMIDVLDRNRPAKTATDTISMTQPAHSVRMLKFIDPSIALRNPEATLQVPKTAVAGETVQFSAQPAGDTDAIVQYIWDLGDGVVLEGQSVKHAYTHAGTFAVKVTVVSVDRATGTAASPISITGAVSTKYHPEAKRRFE